MMSNRGRGAGTGENALLGLLGASNANEHDVPQTGDRRRAMVEPLLLMVWMIASVAIDRLAGPGWMFWFQLCTLTLGWAAFRRWGAQ